MILAFILAAQVAALAPDIPDDLQIILERTACGGECHVYTVTIDARGNVSYDGKEFVRVTGKATGTVSVSRIRELLATVEQIGFFQLRDNYRTIRNPDGSETIVTDQPTIFVTVTRGGTTKRVEDYVGAPAGLREFERQIDNATRSRRWTRIDAPMLRERAATGPVLTPVERVEMFKTALFYDDVDVVEALLEMGEDPNTPIGEAEILPLTMIRSAAAARALLAAGASPVARDARGETALSRAASLAPDFTETLLKAGAPADLQTSLEGGTALIAAAGSGNIGVVRLLLAAGANPFHRVRATSALEAARKGKETEQTLLRFPSSGTPPFVKDFDAVIALLEAATSKKR